MRSVFAFALVCALGIGIASCTDPNTEPRHLTFGHNNDTLVMGPNLRLVDEKDREIPGRGFLPTTCTEPSPDVAIAFTRSLTGQGNYQQPSGPTIGGNINVTANEQATQLEGRTAGVLALRDGLYAACQAYLNGVIGHDAYSVILSQYGNLLVALTGTVAGGTRTIYTAEESAVAALFVACVSAYDPTRLGAVTYKGRVVPNPMLSPRRCSTLLNNIARGTFVMAARAQQKKQPAQGDGKKTETKPTPGSKVTKTQKTVSKTVTESTVPAAEEKKP